MTTGEKMKKVRVDLGITQKELALRLNVTPQLVSQYESGTKKPKTETIEKIAFALNVDPLELYGDEEIEHIVAAIKAAIINTDSSRKSMVDSFSQTIKNMLQARESTANQFYESSRIIADAFSSTANSIMEKQETAILTAFNSLNEKGRYVAIDRVEELTEIPKYQKEKKVEPDNN